MGLLNGIRACSPRMRGWSRDPGGQAGHRGLLPAHAGLVPTHRRTGCDSPSAPRACGVGPMGLALADCWISCSPRMRGWSPRSLSNHEVLCPAPRACGVGPVDRPGPQAPARCSPRMRGWSPTRQREAAGRQLLPAHAGLVPGTPVPPSARRPAPRACGVGPEGKGTQALDQVCSPRMRGWSRPRHGLRLQDELLPAHAGLVPDGRASRGRPRTGRGSQRTTGIAPDRQSASRLRMLGTIGSPSVSAGVNHATSWDSSDTSNSPPSGRPRRQMLNSWRTSPSS